MYNRYRILKDGTFEFHTFKSNVFNSEIWLENDGSFATKDDGSFYLKYNEDGTSNLTYEEKVIRDKFESDFREERNELLRQVDIDVNKAEDLQQDTTKLREYRQKLRDATLTWVMPTMEQGVTP